MKKNILNLCCLLLSFTTIAQDANNGWDIFKAIKYELNTGQHTTPDILNDTPSALRQPHLFISPGIGVMWRNAHRYWQLALSDVYYKKGESEAGFEEKFWFTSIRAERGWRWGKGKRPLQFFLGYAIQPTFQHYQFIPTTSNFFAVQSHGIGLRGQLVPKISYRLSKDLMLDFTVLVLASDLNFTRTRIEDPSLPSEAQIQWSSNSRIVNRDLLSNNTVFRCSIGKIF